MAVVRIAVTLEQPEYGGLLEIASKQLRNPQDQLRHMLRQELGRSGLLPSVSLQSDFPHDGASCQFLPANHSNRVNRYLGGNRDLPKYEAKHWRHTRSLSGTLGHNWRTA